MKLFAGVEGISIRHASAVLATEDGRIVSAARIPYGISLHATPRDLLRPRLLELLDRLVRAADLSLSDLADATVCVGLSGVTFRYDALDLAEEFRALQIDCAGLACTGDAEIAFASHTQSDRGTALTCTTGSIAYATTGTGRYHFGGWGPAIGDVGSGYAMGTAVLRAIGEEYDSGQPPSKLWRRIDAWLREPHDGSHAPKVLVDEWREAAIRWREQLRLLEEHGLSDEGRTAIFAFSHAVAREGGMGVWRTVASGLTIPLMEAYDDKDPTAERIVCGAAADLITQHAQVCRIAGVAPDFGPLVLYGGAVTHNERLQELITRCASDRYGLDINPVTFRAGAARRPVCGALLFAMGGSSGAELRLPERGVIERLVACDEWHQVPELRND